MADSPARLRRKIDGAADLQSVVSAMKAQAAASVGQYQRSVAALADYARTVELGLGACFRQGHRELVATPHSASGGASIRAIVFGSDQGLVGRFNDIVVEHACRSLPAAPALVQVWAVGERVRASLADRKVLPSGVFAVPGSVQAIAAWVGQILVKVIEASADLGEDPGRGEAAELHLFYNRPVSGAAFAPVGQRLLPMDDAWRHSLAQQPWPSALRPEVMGQHAITLRALIREYLFVSIFRACAESLASENASRLAAMERADRNIDKMLLAFNGQFQRLRQSKIDEELSDVLSGAKALSAQAAVAGAACDSAQTPG